MRRSVVGIGDCEAATYDSPIQMLLNQKIYLFSPIANILAIRTSEPLTSPNSELIFLPTNNHISYEYIIAALKLDQQISASN